jgi:hypothetical protein
LLFKSNNVYSCKRTRGGNYHKRRPSYSLPSYHYHTNFTLSIIWRFHTVSNKYVCITYWNSKPRIQDLTLEKQNTSTGCTGIANFIPIKNKIMCVHERTLQRHFWRKHFMDAIPVRQTKIKLSCMFVYVNKHFTVVPLTPPSASKPSFQHRYVLEIQIFLCIALM